MLMIHSQSTEGLKKNRKNMGPADFVTRKKKTEEMAESRMFPFPQPKIIIAHRFTGWEL